MGEGEGEDYRRRCLHAGFERGWGKSRKEKRKKKRKEKIKSLLWRAMQSDT